MAKKEVRFVSFRYNRKGGVKKTFAARDDEESSFFLTYSGGHPFLRG